MSNEQRFTDRISMYLTPRLEEGFLFDELSDGYLARAGVEDILKGVSVPIRMSEISKGLTTVNIARAMAYVIGCDIDFRFRDNYIAYIKRTFSLEDFVKALLSEGVDLADHDDYEGACILFRAAILLDPECKDAYYCYGRACKDAYENGDSEEYIGRFKAESLAAFERLTLIAPDFDMGFYFLGFGYINMGFYQKARLTWERFMELSNEGELRAEIRGFLDKLVEPCRIEEGYNAVLRGSFEEGIAILSEYEEDERFNKWWPLWYYLGEAYLGIGDANSAEEHLLKALQFSPSNIKVMEELVGIYRAFGDTEKCEKYEKKIQIVQNNVMLDREEQREARMPGLS